MLRCLGLLLLATLTRPALAETTFESGASDTDVKFGRRGLVLEQGNLRIDAAPADFALRFGGIGGRSFNQDIPGLRVGRIDDYAPGFLGRATEQTLLQFAVGGGYGVAENLEVGGLIMPVHIAPSGDFGDIEFYGRYRLLTKKNLQLGAQLTLAIPTNTRFGTGIAVPVQLSFDPVRIDTGLELELLFGDTTFVDLDLPVAISVDIIDGFFGGIRSGFFAPDVADLAIPLMGHIGYTLMSGEAPMADLIAAFGWPRFLWTGPGDTVDLDTFDVLLGARFFFGVR